MSAWLLATLLCARASAQVFETGGAAVPVAPVSGAAGASVGAGATPSPILTVPGAASLAPSLNTSAVLKAFPGQAATGLPAGAVRFAPAPLPALPAAAANSASAAPTAHRQASGDTGVAPTTEDSVPPSGISSESSVRAVAVRRQHGAEVAADAATTRLDASGRAVPVSLDDAANTGRLPAESAASFGRRLFDRAGEHSALADGFAAAGAPGAVAASDGPSISLRGAAGAALAPSAGAQGETLRDAVASPVPAGAAPAGAFSFFRAPAFAGASAPALSAAAGAAPSAAAAAPITFERLSLELGSGLVVKVRAALGLSPYAAASRPASAATKTAAAARAPRRAAVPVTSTEWLERRGLLETLSVSEAAATQAAAMPAEAAALGAGLAPALALGRAPSPLPAPAGVAALVLDPTTPARVPPFVWWGLAFLPAALVLLLKEVL
jgi:hypothetical protein